jgi:tRNA(Ile)-lysidine synthase
MLPALQNQLGPHLQAPAWYIAFSGGLDSTVLLHLLADWSRQAPLPPLKAIHVHHGLQVAADAWPGHCQSVCDSLGIPLSIVRVQVPPGASLEQAARQARYQAFTQCLGPGDILLTAQHRDDQAETLLFRLLRGSGLRGLAAMAVRRPLGAGTLVRPLLQISRQALEAHAAARGLGSVEDPSNLDLHFSRNYLRHRVMPDLRERWPQVSTTLARTADHLGEALELLDDLAREDLHGAHWVGEFDWLGLPSLALAPLRQLTPARQRNALRHWLAPLTALPDTRHWQGWDNLRDASTDAHATWQLADGRLQRGDGRLWWLSGAWLRPISAPCAWAEPASALVLPDNGQVRVSGPVSTGPLHIAYRQGGETLQIPGRGRRDLKRLLNESGVPAFARARLPLLFMDGQLHAVANLDLGASDLRLHWSPPTNAQRLR